jgi:hypothetical protein
MERRNALAPSLQFICSVRNRIAQIKDAEPALCFYILIIRAGHYYTTFFSAVLRGL